MFQQRSFDARSFSPRSWRFTHVTLPPVSYPAGGMALPRRKQRDYNLEQLYAEDQLVAELIVSAVLQGMFDG